MRFNPRTPCGVRLIAFVPRMPCMEFQSTHSLRSATVNRPYLQGEVIVSIHALLAECDPSHGYQPGQPRNVSIHALLAECDRNLTKTGIKKLGFNPRTPCGVRPRTASKNGPGNLFQSTHSLRSATLFLLQFIKNNAVSIHALLAECDSINPTGLHYQSRFNPRTPCGVRPGDAASVSGSIVVSIHALLAECDQRIGSNSSGLAGFNPRTPCGVRLRGSWRWTCTGKFQSTHSLRSATGSAFILQTTENVSIHALLAECDCARPYTLLLNRANHTLRQPP